MNLLPTSLHLLLISLIGYGYWRHQAADLKKYYWPALILKLFCGIAVGLLYKYYYTTGDTFQYFEDAKVLSSLAVRDFSSFVSIISGANPGVPQGIVYADPRALFFVKIVCIFNLLTGDNYWAAGFYLSLLSFFGSWVLFKTVARYFERQALPAAVAFLFLPSVAFWTSGMIKESVAYGALFYLSAMFLSAWFDRRISFVHGIISVAALLVLWELKYYAAAIFVAVAVTSLLHRFIISQAFRPANIVLEYFLWGIIFFFPLLLVTLLHPNFYIDRFVDVIVSNNRVYNQVSGGDDIIHYWSLEPTFFSLLVNSPWAFFSGIYRPFLFEAGNLFEVAGSIENFILLVLTVTSFGNLVRSIRSDEQFLLLAAMVFIVLLCIFLALSTPNFGTLSRYRTAFLPFLAFILLCNNPVLIKIQRIAFRL